MKNVLFIFFLLFTLTIKAQVGINTTDPKAQLDIEAGTTPSEMDGLLIPRLDEYPTGVGADQDGMLVFITGDGVPSKGFYYYSQGIGWVAIQNTTGNSNTLNEAYDEGGAGVGRTITADAGAVTITGEDGLVVTGTFGSGNTIDTEVSGAGTRLFFNPNKAAFRAGSISGTQWSNANMGEYSTAVGLDNIASGNASFSAGLANTASGEYATALGTENTASSNESMAIGYQNNATGLRSFVFGSESTASGDYSHAGGNDAQATATNAIALGNGSRALGIDAVALGKTSEAQQNLSTAIAGGTSLAVQSTSMGEGTVASSFGEISIGLFNTGYVPNSQIAFDGEDRLFNVGNGTTNGNRRDAFTILKNGNIGFGNGNPQNPLSIGQSTPWDLSHQNTGQDGIHIIGGDDNSGENSIGGSISFGPSSSTRKAQRKSAIAAIQTGGDIDFMGLAFFVHENGINTSPMVEGMRLTHNRRLGINNTAPSANLDIIGTLQYEDGNEAAGYVLQSDAAGNATWVDPSSFTDGTGAEKIDDLIDGKSDSDGTEDGSSLFLGVNAGVADDSTNNGNVGIGFYSLEDNTTGALNTAVGYQSLSNNVDGEYNTALGGNTLDANTSGIWNTALGYSSLGSNVDGFYNTAAGYGALALNSDGNSNVAIGVNAYGANTSGSFNTVIGVDAATGLTATNNTIIGRRAMNSYSAGGDNVAVGAGAGYYGSGIQNTFIGTSAGNLVGTGERNGSVFIGYGAGSNEASSNKLYIENSTANSDNALIYGEFDTNILRANGELQIGNPTGTGYAMPTDQGTASQVLTSNGNGSTAWLTPFTNLEYPDGFNGLSPLVLTNLLTTSYTVPAGKNLYVTSIFSNSTIANVSIDAKVIAFGGLNSAYTPITKPIIVGASEIITSNVDAIGLNGFLVDATTTPLTQSVTTADLYTVPAGKTLVLLSCRNTSNAHGYARITVDGTILYNGSGNDGALSTGNFLTSFHQPIFVGAGSVLTSPSSSLDHNINGYLIDN